MRLNISPWDILLEFHHQSIVGADPEGTAQVATKLVERIVMSPQHAKALHNALGQAVAQWEAAFGELPDLLGVDPAAAVAAAAKAAKKASKATAKSGGGSE